MGQVEVSADVESGELDGDDGFGALGGGRSRSVVKLNGFAERSGGAMIAGLVVSRRSICLD